MARGVVPIANLNRRLPTVGRIRVGVKVPGTSSKGKAYERPKSIDTFRFTSHDKTALDQVASVYGGTVKPWKEPRSDPGQHEVITEASELRIVLPSDPLGDSPLYEHWSAGGWDRRCDGEVCTRIVKGEDGPEQVEVPCICAAEEAMACDPHTRLSVILPQVRFGGVWMFDTKSWDAAQEMPGMIALLQEAQGRGLTEGILRLEQRHKVVAGETRHYPVVVIALADSMDALAAGAARYGALASSSSEAVAEIGAGDVRTGESPSDLQRSASPAPSDDDVVDAEIVDDRSLADVLPADANDGKALAIARRLGSTATRCEDVRGYELIARVLVEMDLVES